MIPKVIHLCWFSNDPYPVEIKLCMDSWKRVIPDFELRIWRMEDALSINCDYVNEALSCKKWAFAADVVRLYALYTEGGVYMDSDIFLTKRFDEFMNDKFATFHECAHNEFLSETKRVAGKEAAFGLQAAFMIGEKGNKFCKTVLDFYFKNHFLNQDGSMNMRLAPFIYSEMAESIGYKYINERQNLGDGVVIYDAKYFAKTKRDVCEHSFGAHRISHSWKNFNDYPPMKRLEKRIKHYLRECKYSISEKIALVMSLSK